MLVYLHADATDLFPDQWVYLHSDKLRMGRLTNFRNWVPELYGDARNQRAGRRILVLRAGRAVDRARRQDHRLGQWRARSTGLLRDAKILAGHVVRIPRCYPVYARGYREHVERMVAYLQNFRGITPIGRYGSFKYNSQDHSILMGVLAAENLLENRNHDLWAVNTDYGSYQEDALHHRNRPGRRSRSRVGGEFTGAAYLIAAAVHSRRLWQVCRVAVPACQAPMVDL